MESKITYHQQMSYCGKSRCRKCRDGLGHGPYWYAYQTVNGHTTRKYLGKKLPPEIQAALQSAVSLPYPKGTPSIIDNPADALAGAGSSIALTPPSDLAPSSTTTTLTSALDTASVRVSTLGQFRLERRMARSTSWQLVSDGVWQQSRVRALLAYLITSPGRCLNRSQALEALSQVGHGAVNLDKLVHGLRQALTRPGMPRDALLYADEHELVLADQSQIWVDADAFEAFLARIDTLPIASSKERERLLKQAVALYGGDFLPEERNARPVLERRRALRISWVNRLIELVDLSILQESTSSALELLDRLLVSDPANEPAVQRLMIVLAQLKRRGEAIRAYHHLEDLLAREFKTKPSQETIAIFEIIKGDTLISVQETFSAALGAGADDAQLLVSADAINVVPSPMRAGGDSIWQAGVDAMKRVPPDAGQAIQIGRPDQSRLVGREGELQAMRSMVQEIEQRARMQVGNQRRASGLPLDTQRRPQCMVLMGEAGIGKTRLAEEVSREAQRKGWSIAWGRIYSQESGIPYRLWTDALRKIINLVPALSPPSLLSSASIAINGSITTLATPSTALQPLVAILPELTDFLPAPSMPLAVRAGQSRSLEEHQEQLRLWEATRELLITISESSPLLIVLDDIQWGDNSSCELLGYLARHIYGYPIFLLATCRITELPAQPMHPLRNLISHMQREHTVSVLNVDPLSPEQIAQLVSPLPEQLVQLIQQQAAGNPFFAEELARTNPQPFTETPFLPRTVADSLDQRLSRLSPDCQQLLGNAAVLGGSFEFPLIYAMETASSYSDEDTVLTLLEEALQSGVLTEEGTGTRITYHFWHPLLVSHLYDRVSATRRTRLHQRAADVLHAMYRGREEEVAATITYHLVRADADPLHIAAYAELAAERAYTLSAYAEAERFYRLALDHLERQNQSGNHLRGDHLPPDARTRLVFLLERLAECMMVRGNYTEARTLYERLLELHKGPRTPGQQGQYEAQVEAMIWGEIGWTWRYPGDVQRARECCQKGEQVLREAGISGGPAWARLLHQQGSLYWSEGRYEEAQRATREALAHFEKQLHIGHEHKLAGSLDYVSRATRIQRTLEGNPVDLGLIHRFLGALANSEGRRTEALQHLENALTLFEQYEHKRRIAHVSNDLGHIYLKLAQYERAQAALRRALSLAEGLGDAPLTSVVFWNLAELAAASNDLEEAESWYRRALVLIERINDREYLSQWNAGLAVVLLGQDRLDEAATCIKRALSIGRAIHNNPCIGNALIALGNARIRRARNSTNLPNLQARLLAHARTDLNRALAIPGLDAETRTRGALALAQIAQLSGQTDQARTQIEQVIEEAHKYELVLLEERARGMLRG